MAKPILVVVVGRDFKDHKETIEKNYTVATQGEYHVIIVFSCLDLSEPKINVYGI